MEQRVEDMAASLKAIQEQKAAITLLGKSLAVARVLGLLVARGLTLLIRRYT